MGVTVLSWHSWETDWHLVSPGPSPALHKKTNLNKKAWLKISILKSTQSITKKIIHIFFMSNKIHSFKILAFIHERGGKLRTADNALARVARLSREFTLSGSSRLEVLTSLKLWTSTFHWNTQSVSYEGLSLPLEGPGCDLQISH